MTKMSYFDQIMNIFPLAALNVVYNHEAINMKLLVLIASWCN